MSTTPTVAERIVAHLKAELPKEVMYTVGEIVKAVGASESTVRKQLEKLVTEGAVFRHEQTTGPALYAIARATDKPAPKRKKEKDPNALQGRGDKEAANRRDRLVFDRIKSHGGSKKELSEATGLTEALVYLSIFRLKKAELIRLHRDGTRTPVYFAVEGAKAPELEVTS